MNYLQPALGVPPAPRPIMDWSLSRLDTRRQPLQDNTLIAHAARQPLAVQVLEQGYRILSRDPGQFLERWNTNALAFGFLVACQQAAKAFKRRVVKNQLRGHAHQNLFAQQDLQQFLSSRGFDFQLCQDILDGRHGEAGLGESLYNLLLRADLLGRKGDLRARLFDELALHGYFL